MRQYLLRPIALTLLAVTACSSVATTDEPPPESAESAAISTPVAPAPAARPRLATAALGKIVPLDGSGNDIYDNFPPEARDTIRAIAQTAQTIMSLYAGVGSAISIVTSFLKFAGVLDNTDATTAQFRALNQHLDDIAGALSWYDAQTLREDRINKQFAAIDTAAQAINLGSKVSVTDAAVVASMTAVYDAEGDTAFLRFWSEAITDGRVYVIGHDSNAAGVKWKQFIPDRPDHPNDFAYDWRLGVPELLQLISLRLQVIAGVDPNFKTDGIFNVELERHRQALIKQYANMVNGVRCTWEGAYTLGAGDQAEQVSVPACADINTGTALITWGPVNNPDTPALIDGFRRQLFANMPLFQMRAMIDQLYAYEHPAADLAAQNHRIGPLAGAGLCLDVEGAGGANGTQSWLFGCNEGPSQEWTYDRQSGVILNVASNRCLTVRAGARTQGTPVEIDDCTGDASQKWTFDPASHVLQSGVNTVLDIDNANLVPEQPLWTWDRNEGNAQQWLADPGRMFTTFDAFGIGTGPGYHLFHETGTSDGAVAHAAWSDWGLLGGSTWFIAGPASVSWGSGRTDVFALDSNYHLRHGFVDPGSPGCASSSGSPCVDDWGYFQPFVGKEIALSSWGDQHLDLFGVGQFGKAGMLYQRTWDHGKDSGWSSQASPDFVSLVSAPAAASSVPGVVDAFAIASDGGIYRSTGADALTRSVWTQWLPPWTYGGSAVTWKGKPGVASWGPGRFDVMMVDTQGRLFDCGGDNGVPWGHCDEWARPAGITFTDSPAVTPMGSGQILVFVRGSDGQGWIKAWSPNQDMGPWVPSGGALQSGSTMGLASCVGDACATSGAPGRIPMMASRAQYTVSTPSTWSAAAGGSAAVEIDTPLTNTVSAGNAPVSLFATGLPHGVAMTFDAAQPAGIARQATITIDPSVPAQKIMVGITAASSAGVHSIQVPLAITACVPTSCAAHGYQCGTISNGCGGTLTCGTCGTGQSCTANVCEVTTCAKVLHCPKGLAWTGPPDCACESIQ